jgi:hypothetical protein
MKRLPSVIFVVALAAAVSPSAGAQTVDQWTAIQQLQADLKADRQAVVAVNLPLTEGEPARSGPSKGVSR